MINIRKIIMKILIILVCISIFTICVPRNHSIAWDSSSDMSVYEYASSMTGNTSTDIESDQLSDIIGRVVGAIQVIAGLFSVLTIALTGLEYVLCSTSEMQRELKNRMLPIIISLVFIFGAVSIAKFIIKAFENV